MQVVSAFAIFLKSLCNVKTLNDIKQFHSLPGVNASYATKQ
jgi:hypothetical protein